MGVTTGAASSAGVVFIDARTPDLQTLLNGLTPGQTAFVVDPGADGLAQVAAILGSGGYDDLASIALVGHGSAGEMDFGASTLSDAALPQDAAELRDIASHLSADGQLALFACDTASGTLGQAFLADLASTAGVEVAASTHTVGGAAQGGDFTLDAAAGGTSAPVAPFNAAAQAAYQGALASQGATAEFFANYGDGSPQALLVADVNGASLLSSSQLLTNDSGYFASSQGSPFQIILDTVDNLAFVAYYYSKTVGNNTIFTYRIEEGRISDLLNPTANHALTVVYDAGTDSTHSEATNGAALAGTPGDGALRIDTTNHVLYWADGNDGGYAPTYVEKIIYSPTTLGLGTNHVIIAKGLDFTNGSTGGFPGGFSDLTIDYAHNVGYLANTDTFDTTTDANYLVKVNLTTGAASTVTLANDAATSAAAENTTSFQSNFFSLNYGVLQGAAVDAANQLLYFTTRLAGAPNQAGATAGVYKLNLASGVVSTVWSQTAAYGSNPSGPTPDGALGEIYIDVARGKYYVEVDGAPGSSSTRSTDTNIFEGNLSDSGTAPVKLLTSPLVSGSSSGSSILGFVADTAPTLSVMSFGNTWMQNSSPTRVIVASTASDQDSNASQLTGGSVSLTTGFLAGDTLAATTSGTNVTASYASATGVLTLSGIDTFAHYQQVLNSVTFSSTSANPTNYHADTFRSVSFAVSDGLVSSPNSTASITVQAVDQPGVISGASPISLTETNAALSATRSLTFADPDTTTASTVSVTFNSYALSGSGTVNSSLFQGYLGVAPSSVSPGGSGTLTFNSGSEAFDYLAAGQTLTLNYTLGWSGGTAPATVTITGTNDAPVTSGATQALNSVAGNTQPAGQTLSSLLASHTSDVDNGSSLLAAAVTANGSVAASGQWQYSADGGASWTNVGAASPSAAVLIHAADLVRFLPTTGFSGAAPALTVHAVDDTQAAFTDGATVSLTTSGGTTPYSTGTVDLTETVTPANHPPVIGGAAAGQATGDNAALGPFAAITVTDADAGQTETVTVSFTAANGALAGGGFTGSAGAYTFAGLASDAQAALRALAFTPTANQVAPGATVTTTFSVAVNDGTATTTDANTSVVATSINDAPVLNGAAVGTPAQVLEDSHPAGQTVASLLGSAFSDADTGSSLSAVAVTSNGSSASTGQWQLSSDGGSTWTNVGAASPTAAVLVHAASLLRFLPAADYNGASPALVAHLVDNTQASFADGATVSLATTGGTTPYSSGAASLSTTVVAVNDPPTFTKGADQTVNEDAGPQTVSGWATGISPGPANESGQAVSFTVGNSNTSLFSVQPTVSAGGVLTYTSAPNANGSATVTVIAHDDGGVSNGGVDTSAAQTFTITVAPVNDPPVVTAGTTAAFTEKGPAVLVAPTATVSDVDSPSFAGGSVTVHLAANGGASDQLSLVNQGSGPGQIGVSGSTVSYGGSAIGTVFGGANGADLGVALSGAGATPAAVQALLRDVAFSNASNNPSTAARSVSLVVVDGGGAANGGSDTGSATATVTVTAVNDPPAIGGTAANQAVTDKTTATPFSTVAVTDPDSASLTATLTVTAAGVASDADGMLSGSGLTKTGTGTYALSAGTPSAVSMALAALVFTPAANQVAPGSTVTTGFTLAVNDGQATTTDTTTTVAATSVNDAPTLAGTHASSVNDRATVAPFSGVTAGDPDVGQTETATLTYAPAAGALSYGAGASGVAFTGAAGSYTLSAGSAADLTAALRAVSFAPTAAAAGPSTQTTFSVSVSDGTAATASDAGTVVTVAHTTNTPVSASNAASSGQAVTDKQTASPFAGLTVGDGADAGQTYQAAVTYTGANGTLAVATGQSLPAGTTLAGSAGSYTLTADMASHLQSALQALTFTPTQNQVTPGQTVQTAFALAVSDLSGAAVLSTTTLSDMVTTTSVNDAPTLAGTHASSVNDHATGALFSGVAVADPDVGQTETATVSFAAANATLLGAGAVTTANGVATYTLSASSGSALTAALQAVTFAPTAQAAGTAATQTTFAVSVSDGMASNAIDSATIVTATHTTNTPPVLGGSSAASAVNDIQSATPFSAITVTDPDVGQTQTATVSFTAANGTFAGLGAATVANGTATYTVAGAASAVQATLQAATFTPTANQVAPGQTVQTTFTVRDTDSTGATAAAPATATLTATSVNDAPTLSGAHASTTADYATDALFSGVTVADPDPGQTETATISFAAANGVLSGAGAATIANGVAAYTVSAASASALTAALRAVTFAPVTAPPGAAATTTAVTLTVGDGTASSGADMATVVTATHTGPAPVTVAPGQTFVLGASGFPLVTGDVVDNGVVQIGGAPTPVTYTGSISGTGSVTVTGGTVTFTGASAYTGPTTVASGALLVDGSIANSPVTVGDGAVLGGHGTTGPVTAQPGATLSPGESPGVLGTGSLSLASGAALKEEIGGLGSGQFDQTVVTGTVTLTGATLNAGLYGGYAAPTTTSAPIVIIDNDGTDAVVGTFAGLPEGAVFELGGAPVKISYVGGTGNDVTLQFVGVATSPPPPTPAAPTPSQTAEFATQIGNLMQAGATDPSLSDPASPLYAQVQAEKGIAVQLDSGQITLADAQNALYHLVDGTTSVAEIAYAFFAGKTPTQAGLTYLVHSDINATDLNDAYYAQFTTENRYINFAVNLSTGAGAGAAAFQANYGSLSLSDATAKAYALVFGTAPAAGKVDAILNAQVSNGLGGTETRAQYFADITGGSAAAQKAAAIGFLLADSVKEGFGTYQQADLHFLQDLAHGTAVFNVDLLAAYGTAPSLVGQPIAGATLGG